MKREEKRESARRHGQWHWHPPRHEPWPVVARWLGPKARPRQTKTQKKVHTRWRTPAMKKKTPFSLFRASAGLNPTTDQMTAYAAASSCSRHHPRSSKNSASPSQVHTPEPNKTGVHQFSVFRSVQMNNLLAAKRCNCTTIAATTNDESRRENNNPS